ncbi:MAG: dihydropteroate synthase [Chloroflexi bacterium]|nr:dihydropteroate synthase [Chloroflexota bacterium]
MTEAPRTSATGLRPSPGTTQIGPTRFAWGTRTFVMGIINVTPDSFSGDGLLRGAPVGGGQSPAVMAAIELAASMADAGADLIDIGGESTRPGYARVDPRAEIARVVPVVRGIRAALPHMPISVDTTKPAVAEAAVEAGANLINDIWGVASDDALLRLTASLGAPIVLMHNREEARYTNFMAEVIGDLERAIERALAVGVAWEDILIDPGFGFGKSADHNVVVLRELETLAILGRPLVLGTSRKSTLGRILDVPQGQRLEATLATTALGVASGADMVRVHDVRENVRAARVADAIVRGTWHEVAT